MVNWFEELRRVMGNRAGGFDMWAVGREPQERGHILGHKRPQSDATTRGQTQEVSVFFRNDGQIEPDANHTQKAGENSKTEGCRSILPSLQSP